MMPSSENTNIPGMGGPERSTQLARIRDNQRRSRARRKEYLQELEHKYRECEQTGVAASAQVQAAARRVLDENRRLRQLLYQHGLDDANIDRSLRGERDPPADSLAVSPVGPAEQLHSVLGTRLPCGGGNCCDSSAPERTVVQGGATQQGRTLSAAASTRYGGCSTEQSPTASEHWRSSGNSSETAGHTTSLTLLQPRSASPKLRRLLPTADSAVGVSNRIHDLSGMPNAMLHPGDAIGTADWTWPSQDLHNPHDTHSTANNSHYYEISRDSSSCVVAAHSIRAMQPGLGRELEQELGCVGEDCECRVPNTHIFTLMDRYSEPQL